ncbi:MAG: hypothetical protein JNM66_15700 [Bryobacterales bacterium]|nr:hypothetical protein [Bryobacterales bacterium]
MATRRPLVGLGGGHALGPLVGGLSFGQPSHCEFLLSRVGEPMGVGAIFGVVQAPEQRDGFIAIATTQGQNPRDLDISHP